MFLTRVQLVIILILVPVGLLFLYAENKDASIWDFFTPGEPVMRIGEIPIRVEIADTNSERVTGLSGRPKLEGIEGLLFVFPENDYHGIWMKDMHFPIDIIWISEDLEVVGIHKNISPRTYPEVFRPPEPAKYVVETNIHYVDTFGISVGQKVILPPKYLDN